MTAAQCPSCGKPYTEHMGLIGTCANLQELRKLADAIYGAWETTNAEKLAPDLSNHYTSRMASTEFALAMLRLGNLLKQLENT